MALPRRDRRAATPARFRRSPHLVAYWQGSQLEVDQHARGTRTAVSPALVELLDAFDRWLTIDAARDRVPGLTLAQVRRAVPRLLARGLLVQEGAPAHPADAAADTWRGWNPAAGFFHQATRDLPYWPAAKASEYLSAKARREPPPPPVSRTNDTGEQREIPLLPPVSGVTAAARQRALVDALRDRRTWRRFGAGGVSLAQASTILGLTFGVQSWVTVPGFGRMPLKTAPSGGARHSIEAYVAARRVAGLSPGFYHYAADTHALVTQRAGLTAAALGGCFPQQSWIGRASLVVFMAAVFARAQWRYPFARAYRTVLAECGHHAQSFCLLATALGLAPFCTMAFGDTHVERELGLDGRRTAVLYAVGVGLRPRGQNWAPWPHTGRTPRRESTPLGGTTLSR